MGKVAEEDLAEARKKMSDAMFRGRASVQQIITQTQMIETAKMLAGGAENIPGEFMNPILIGTAAALGTILGMVNGGVGDQFLAEIKAQLEYSYEDAKATIGARSLLVPAGRG